jgi:curli production assembly/transport component CsgF
MFRAAVPLFVVVCLCTGGAGALASDLVYTPINPTFGGNPLNSSHLLSIAGAQKTATASDAPISSSGSGTGTGGGTDTQSEADLFLSQLEGRLLSALASQVTDAIFGADPQQSGTIVFGDTTISFDQTTADITLLITQDGTTTTISVPKLQTTP